MQSHNPIKVAKRFLRFVFKRRLREISLVVLLTDSFFWRLVDS